MKYAGTFFPKPLRPFFSPVYRPSRNWEITPADKPYFPTAVSYESTRILHYEKLLYRPVVNGIMNVAQQLRRLQTGNIQWYLLYIFLALLCMFLFMRLR